MAVDKRLLKRTRSRCPTCHTSCPAEVWLIGAPSAKVFLRRSCPQHGEISVCIASDARFYWLAHGNPQNSDCSETFAPDKAMPAKRSCCAATGRATGTLGRNALGRGEGPFETLSTCLALIEIVQSCNLSCPTCYADSPKSNDTNISAVPVEQLKNRIQGVIDRKGRIEILQLSGGEPTLHPEFFALVEWVQNHPNIDYLLINTNGVRLAKDPQFAARFAAAARNRRLQLYLQFDGIQEAGQRSLRGVDLRELRRLAIERCLEIKLPLTLAMTVTPQNLGGLWQAIHFGLQYSHIRGICFQPLFLSGRLPAGDRGTRLNTADIIMAAVEQSNRKLRFEDFTPLPCGDPNCATIGYLLKVGNTTRSVSEFIDFSKLHDFLRDKVRYKLEDLARCGCESEPLGHLLKRFEMDESNTFRILIKPFMHAGTWDEDRIDRCCTHVIRPDGQLDSFCRYYSGFADLKARP